MLTNGENHSNEYLRLRNNNLPNFSQINLQLLCK